MKFYNMAFNKMINRKQKMDKMGVKRAGKLNSWQQKRSQWRKMGRKAAPSSHLFPMANVPLDSRIGGRGKGLTKSARGKGG
jgi:hypothetical protein